MDGGMMNPEKGNPAVILTSSEMVEQHADGTFSGQIYGTVNNKCFGHLELRAQNLEACKALSNAFQAWIRRMETQASRVIPVHGRIG